MKAHCVALLLAALCCGAMAQDSLVERNARKLLGTLTITGKQGDVWASQTKIQTGSVAGDEKISTGFATGSAVGANDWSCLFKDCDNPVAVVNTRIDPTAGPSTGLAVAADTTASGSRFSDARTNTGSVDSASNPRTSALATFFGNSQSTQKSATAASNANAFAGIDAALATGTGAAAAGPAGAPNTNAEVNVRTFLNTDRPIFFRWG